MAIKIKSKFKQILSIGISFVLLMSLLLSSSTAIADDQSDSFESLLNSKFENPEMDYRVEARWWLAEGSHTDETLKESIQELYDSGIGAVEFVTLDESDYLDDATYAWGSEEWIHDSLVVMEECTRLGMGVSFTSGTHWATANLTVISPDDESASQQLSYSTQKVDSGQTFSGSLPLPTLPSGATELKFEKVIAARVSATDDNALASDSLTDISSYVQDNGNGTWDITYTAPNDGDYILFGFWRNGTGESYKPAATGESYTINYFDKSGSEALIDYWNEHVLSDEMQKLILENGDVSMYMDSLELNTRGENDSNTHNLWSKDFLNEFESRCGYDLSLYLPTIIATSDGGWGSDVSYQYTLDGEEELNQKIRRDLYQVNTELYMENCLDVLTEWLHGNGITLRAENSYGKLLEISQPIKSVDYVETESLEFGTEVDTSRNMAGGAHLYNKLFSSETGAMLGGNYLYNNNFYRQMFYTQFAAGVQRTVLHGYSSAYGPSDNVNWPGYEGMAAVFAERFNKRQPNAIDYPEFMGQVARLQKALRQGVPQMDIGILRTDYNFNNGIWKNPENNSLRNHTAYYWQDMTLQDSGFTYDYFSPYLLQDEDISCANNAVQADGVAYQALVVYQEEMPYESAQVLLDWAKNGLPVVFVDGYTEENCGNFVKTNEGAAITTGRNDGKDDELKAIIDELKTLDSVAVVTTQADAYDALIDLGVRPRAEYTSSNDTLLSVLRKDNDASYLYVYNYMYTDEENYVGEISVDGIYEPYVLDTWSGSSTKLAEYSYENGRTVLNVDIEPGEVVVFALDPNAQSELSIIGKNNVDKVTIENDEVTMYISTTGEAALIYSDYSTYKTTADVPEDIALDDWSLKVESWEPGEKVYRYENRGLGYVTEEASFNTAKRIIDVGTTDLIPWKDIDSVGDYVSGVGYYSNTFTLPSDWSSDNAIIFNASSFSGGTAALFVNGQQAPINMDSCEVDITDFVQQGENTIEVRVTSSLRNVMIAQQYSGWMGNTQSDDYGMVGTTELSLYTKVSVKNESPSSVDSNSQNSDNSTNSDDSTKDNSKDASIVKSDNNTNGSKTASTSPRTGDTPIVLIAVILIACLASTAYVIKCRKKSS